MRRDAAAIREGGPVIFAEIKNGVEVDHIIEHILAAAGLDGKAAQAATGGPP